MTNHAPDPDRAEPITRQHLDERLAEIELRQKAAHSKTFQDAVGVGVGIMLAVATVVGLAYTFWPEPSPRDVGQNLEELLKPGVHCFDTTNDMHRAQMRAMEGIDRLEWERDFERRWEEKHPADIDEGPFAIPDTPTSAHMPRIVGPHDAAVPQPVHGMDVDADRCFGVTSSAGPKS